MRIIWMDRGLLATVQGQNIIRGRVIVQGEVTKGFFLVRVRHRAHELADVFFF